MMKIDQMPVYPILASLLLGAFVWGAARVMNGSHLIGAVFGFISFFVCILTLLVISNVFGTRVSIILFVGFFSMPIGAVLGTLFGSVAGGYLGMISAFFMGAFFGDIFHQLFMTRKEVDQEELHFEELAEKASEAHRTDEFKKEINLLKEILNSGKDKLPARTSLKIARVYENDLYQHDEAAYWFRKCIAFANQDGTRDENLFAREATEGLARLAALKESKKSTPVEDLVEAKELIEKENFEQAEKKLHELEQLYPNNAEVNYLFAHYFLFRHNFGMAEEHFERTLQKDPDHVLAAFNLACTRQSLELLVKAKRDFERYIEMAKDDPEEADRVEESNDRIARIEEALENFVLDGKGQVRS